MNFLYPLVDYLKSREKVFENCLKKTKQKEISKEKKEELEERYQVWHKNTYNPFLNYVDSSQDIKK